MDIKNKSIFAVLSFSILALIMTAYSSTFQSAFVTTFAKENQTGNINEAEVEAEIEQENKCKKDTECENENEINNLLNITTVTQTQQQEQPETSTCEDCFTTILSSEQLENFLINFSEIGPEVTTVEELCDVIERDQGNSDLDSALLNAAQTSGLNEQQYEELIQCLQDAGLDVDIPPA